MATTSPAITGPGRAQELEQALAALEAVVTDETLGAWEDGRTALRGDLPPAVAPPGLTENRLPADDPAPKVM